MIRLKKQGIDPEAIGLRVLGFKPRNKYQVFCPFQKHKNAHADFDPFTGKFFCYACKTTSNHLELARLLGGNIQYILIEPQVENEKQTDWKKLNNLKLALDNGYLMRRRVTSEQIIEFQIKEDEAGIYIPIYDLNEKLIGINHRKSAQFARVRYIYYGQMTALYPLNYLKNLNSNDEIVLVEGIFGAFRGRLYDKNVFATLGSNPSVNLRNLLSNFKNIKILYDNDFAGYLGASKLSLILPQAKIIVPGCEADEMSMAFWQNINELVTTRSLTEIATKYIIEEDSETFRKNITSFSKYLENL